MKNKFIKLGSIGVFLVSFLLGLGQSYATKTLLDSYGATFQMIKLEYTSGEYRHALALQYAENIKVFGFTFKDSG